MDTRKPTKQNSTIWITKQKLFKNSNKICMRENEWMKEGRNKLYFTRVVRERERERETDRQTETETDRQTDRQTDRFKTVLWFSMICSLTSHTWGRKMSEFEHRHDWCSFGFLIQMLEIPMKRDLLITWTQLWQYFINVKVVTTGWAASGKEVTWSIIPSQPVGLQKVSSKW